MMKPLENLYADCFALFETCSSCGGSGMSLDSYNGEPTLCPECKGDCNVPVNEQAAMILDIIECLYILEQKIDALDGQNNP